MNPQWGWHAPTLPAKFIDLVVRPDHHECDNAVCKHASFTYGAGFPSLWSQRTSRRERTTGLPTSSRNAPLPSSSRCGGRFARNVVPSRAGRNCPPIRARCLRRRTPVVQFIAGKDNQCFLPESQERSFAYLDSLRANYHSLHVIPGYGHLNPFIGKHAERDVFPDCAERARAWRVRRRRVRRA